jgi:hypothetical protein
VRRDCLDLLGRTARDGDSGEGASRENIRGSSGSCLGYNRRLDDVIGDCWSICASDLLTNCKVKV